MLKWYIRFLGIFAGFFLSWTGTAEAQTFAGFGGAITNTGSQNFYQVTVNGLSGGTSSSFGLFGVNVNITHPSTGDLDIFVIGPDNTVVELSSGNGGTGKNYDNCMFTNLSKVKISSGKAPFNGSFKPEGSLGVFNAGLNPNGNWKLLVIDRNRNKDSGLVKSWSLIFSNTPSKLEPLVNSNLPLMLINTGNRTIMDEPRIYAKMRIINDSSGVNALADSSKYFNYLISIEARGSTSQSFPKRPYGFTTHGKNLADTNVKLLGMPKEHDWVLNATYNDKSLMRDYLAYNLARRAGQYATRTRYVELFINGKYEGIYMLLEKIKRDDDRVNISKLTATDTSGVNLTGGYIIKIDKTTGNNNGGWTDSFPIAPGSGTKVFYQYDYPNGSNMLQVQKNYIRDALYRFEIALASSNFTDKTKGYWPYIDVITFIDYSIINEISKNVDGYRLSTYFFKDKDSKDPRFKMGPIWDFNLAFNNADYNNSSDPNGWEIDLSFGCPFWWKRFRQDTGFMRAYYCRWNELRQTTLSIYNLNAFIDSTYAYLEQASYRNFDRWPVMGKYIWPNPSPLSYSMKEEVEGLKKWIEKRCEWFDAELAKNCNTITYCKPEVVLFSDKVTLCKGQQANLFADGVGNTFTWFPSTGLNTTKGRRVIASPTTTTRYRVVMTTSSGCNDTSYITITVLSLPDKSITGATSICEGRSTQLSGKSSYNSYQWSPATGLDKTTGQTVNASPLVNTTYKMVVTDSMGCKDSAYAVIKLNAKPNMKITSDKPTVCMGDTAVIIVTGASSYKWSPAKGLKDSVGSRVVVYPANNRYLVTGTSSFQCTDTISIFVGTYPYASMELAASSQMICYGANTLISAKDGQPLLWRPTDDFGGGSFQVISVSPKVNTIYTALGVNQYGCSDSGRIQIDVYPKVTISVSGDTSLCRGGKTMLSLKGASSFQWWPQKGLTAISDFMMQAGPDSTTTYTIVGTTTSLCRDTIQRTVHVFPLPVVVISPKNPEITEGEKQVLKAKGATTYTWSPNLWLNKTMGDSVIASPLISTRYFATGMDLNGCIQKDSVDITVKKPVVLIRPLATNTLTIYPNPVQEKLFVESPLPGRISIYASNGTMVLQKAIDSGTETIDMAHLAKGLYQVRVDSSAGVTTFRVFKD